MPLRALFVLGCLALAGCATPALEYPPPAQLRPFQPDPPAALANYVAFNQPGAAHYIVSGMEVVEGGGPWRRCTKNAELHFQLPSARAMHFHAIAAAPAEILANGGSQRLTVFVNGHKLETFTLDKPGSLTLDAPLPPEWIAAGRPVTLRLESEREHIDPHGGPPAALLLAAIGFVQ
jgi:hypothetical protein